MALITSYLMTTKNVESFFNSIISAKAPEKFTQKFLESLEFKSTNDRLYIGLLKGLGFIDEGGVPTARYYNFMDQTQTKIVLAESMEEAYEDLFNVNQEAYKLSEEEVKNKLRTLTQGKYSDNVLSLMAKTFRALAEYATWSTKKSLKTDKSTPEINISKPVKEQIEDTTVKKTIEGSQLGLHYNIQIHLPETRDPAVYDALFRSLKDHIL